MDFSNGSAALSNWSRTGRAFDRVDGTFKTEDYPVGTLISPKFRIMGPKLSFLLGGGCDFGKIRVELLVNDQIVRKAFADECRENLRRREWDVRQFKNQFGQIRLVDASRKGHINFDDLWGDFTCNGECFFLLKLMRGIKIFYSCNCRCWYSLGGNSANNCKFVLCEGRDPRPGVNSPHTRTHVSM